MRSELTAGGAFHQATDFMAAAARLDSAICAGEPEQLRLMAPSIVCTAFAIELFFKSMLGLAGKPSKGHNLKALFEKLDDSTKDRLRAALSCTSETFEVHLSRVASAFTSWRYAHEQGTLSIEVGFIRRLCKAALAEAELHFLERGLQRVANVRAGGNISPGSVAE